ncbi:hypothetical protein QAD02_017581 [Eretmocerus hayati]|uniref:Uncharacterized protein n=1 Tax=Eretmocerus hayati TaxID=131215 RepID=A0ACC2PDY5_9HYME|nr:hypothetical protein QAD02_017581 [Eretmocerus hayati]
MLQNLCVCMSNAIHAISELGLGLINIFAIQTSPESPSPSVAFSYEFELENERIKFGEEPDWGAEGSLNPRANLTISGANVAFQPVFEHVVPSGDIMIWINFDVFVRSPPARIPKNGP